MTGQGRPSAALRDNITEFVEYPDYHGAIRQKLIGRLAYICFQYLQR